MIDKIAKLNSAAGEVSRLINALARYYKDNPTVFDADDVRRMSILCEELSTIIESTKRLHMAWREVITAAHESWIHLHAIARPNNDPGALVHIGALNEALIVLNNTLGGTKPEPPSS